MICELDDHPGELQLLGSGGLIGRLKTTRDQYTTIFPPVYIKVTYIQYNLPFLSIQFCEFLINAYSCVNTSTIKI